MSEVPRQADRAVSGVPSPFEGALMFERWKNPETRARVDRIFHVPMLVLALLILPLLGVELFADLSPTGELLVELGFWVVWLAFVVEFALKISIADGKWHYVRRNWLDIVVIIAPVLRPLRVLRLARGFQIMRSLRLLYLRAVAQKALTVIIYLIAEYRALRKGIRSSGGADEAASEDASEVALLLRQVASLQDRVSELESQVRQLTAELEEIRRSQGAASSQLSETRGIGRRR